MAAKIFNIVSATIPVFSAVTEQLVAQKEWECYSATLLNPHKNASLFIWFSAHLAQASNSRTKKPRKFKFENIFSTKTSAVLCTQLTLLVFPSLTVRSRWYTDGAGNTIKEKSSVFSLIRMCYLLSARAYRQQNLELECGPMPNTMAPLPNIGGAICSKPQSLADAHY